MYAIRSYYAIIVISLSTTGASLNKGVMRVAGTGLGALAGFVLLSWFAQSPSYNFV